MLVQKPQFDTEVLKPGVAIRVTIKGSRYNDRSYNALVTNSNPLGLDIDYVDTTEGNKRKSLFISIEQVVDKSVELKILELPKVAPE